jgi:Family of unknown function (DUF5946)
VPDICGPVHGYIGAAPGCWAAYCGLEDWKAALFQSDAIETAQHLVDAYAAQHPANPDRRNRQSVAVHLMSLCASLEYSLTGRRLRSMMGAWTHRDYPLLRPHPSEYPVTVIDIVRADTGGRAAAVTTLAISTWSAWSAHHRTVRSWLTEAEQWS